MTSSADSLGSSRRSQKSIRKKTKEKKKKQLKCIVYFRYCAVCTFDDRTIIGFSVSPRQSEDFNSFFFYTGSAPSVPKWRERHAALEFWVLIPFFRATGGSRGCNRHYPTHCTGLWWMWHFFLASWNSLLIGETSIPTGWIDCFFFFQRFWPVHLYLWSLDNRTMDGMAPNIGFILGFPFLEMYTACRGTLTLITKLALPLCPIKKCSVIFMFCLCFDPISRFTLKVDLCKVQFLLRSSTMYGIAGSGQVFFEFR